MDDRSKNDRNEDGATTSRGRIKEAQGLVMLLGEEEANDFVIVGYEFKYFP